MAQKNIYFTEHTEYAFFNSCYIFIITKMQESIELGQIINKKTVKGIGCFLSLFDKFSAITNKMDDPILSFW